VLLFHLCFWATGTKGEECPRVTKTIRLENGYWFNGSGFDLKTLYINNGLFSSTPPGRLDTTIDLHGQYVLPPLAEAHNHNIGTGNPGMDRQAVERYVKAGVFYVKIPGNLPLSEEAKMQLGINRPGRPDVKFANGIITATGGHPIKLMETLLSRGYSLGETKETLKNKRYFCIDKEEDIENTWPLIMRNKPEFIKVMTANSEDYEKNKNDTSIWYKAMDPKLIGPLVRKAHGQGLTVTCHINNTADLRVAIQAGVDEIAHMPRMISGIPYVPISQQQAQMLAREKVPVITTLAVSLFQGGTIKQEDHPIAKERQKEDLKMLKENGALIAIGSDDPPDTSVKEVFYLKELGVFSHLELIKMWTEVTPSIIFPGRKIGKLMDGYEASFITTKEDPTKDMNQLRNIILRCKQG
jgi:imidazolonepropionase-like amidohydrolase